MHITMKLAIASAFAALAACGGNNNANNTDMNAASDLNAGTTDMNTTDMNATDMNAGGAMTDMNATGNADMNAGMTGNSSSNMGATTNNGM